jgi:acyl-CoA synthetase (NDP forming)
MPETLSPTLLKAIDSLLGRVYLRGRQVLYEHEVYRILAKLGIATPAHVFVRKAAQITPEVLARLPSPRVVLKVAAPDITHKLKAGGVRIVHKDLDFIRYSFQRMWGELQSQGHLPDGILLAAWEDYAKDLGNEVLLGFRESDAFGPVISFSKGGSDAEHFAEHFSPPNLILAPIDRQWAQALLNSTGIQKKYLAEGHTDYVAKIVEAGLKLSRMAVGFSNFFAHGTRFVLPEFEINPFVFTAGGRFIALDGFAAFAPRAAETVYSPAAPEGALTPFFEPQGIAVIGVSRTDPATSGNIIVRNLLQMKRSDVYAVNPKGGQLDFGGRRLPISPSLAEIPARVELAVVAVPAENTVPVMAACAEKGVRAVILIAGGFSETRKNADIEAQLLAIARQNGIRIVGPNCLGIVYSGDGDAPGLNTFFVPEEKFRLDLAKPKNVAILSQSGALGITEIYNLRHAISPKVIVSYGNQLDVDPADLIAYLEGDPAVDVIGCYIEGFKKGGGRKFFNTARRCTKPVIVYKAGRTEAGRRATESHTASIAGEYAVAKAALKQAGLIVTDTMLDHGDFIKTFALLNDFEVRGNRLAIVANAGYEKTYAADNLGGLEVAQFEPQTAARLRAVLPPLVAVEPLLDLTPMAGEDVYERCIDTLLGSDAVDALFVSIVPHSIVIHTTDEEIDRNRENIAARIVRLVHRHRKPTVVSVNVVSGADAVYNKFGQILDAGGVPTFLTAQRAMVCLNAFIRYRLTRASGALSEWLK